VPDDASAVERYRARLSPAAFSHAYLKWTPYPYQQEVMDAVLRHGKDRIAWVAGRRVGKTHTTANIALQLAVRKPGTQVAIFAPTFKQACMLSDQVKVFLRPSPYRAHVVVDKVDEIRLRFGHDELGRPIDSVILTNSLKGQVRGQGADVLIIDESAFCDSEDYRSKAMPFIADRKDAVIIHISTVYNEDDHFMDALKRYPHEPRGAVFRTLTRQNPGVTQKRLDEYRASMLESEYRREYEAELVPEDGVFDRRALTACMQDYELLDLASLGRLEPKRHHRYHLGVDWGKKQDCAVIAVIAQGTLDKGTPARLVFLQVYKPDPENAHHYTRILDDVQRVAKQVNAHRVVADEGEGGHQAEVLANALGKRFRPYRFSGKSRNWLVDNAQTLVERRAVELPMEPDDVRKAFANIRKVDGGYEHASPQSKDIFDAIALALLEAGDAETARHRKPRKLAVAEGGRRAGHGAPAKPRKMDARRLFFPRDVWRYIEPVADRDDDAESD
jgi:phage terminase large subunit GpA